MIGVVFYVTTKPDEVLPPTRKNNAGTSKYPVENAYKSYLAKHGGRSNASTAMDATTFKFEVGADHLRRER